MEVDAIVNAANTGLQAGGGVCGAIFEAAGADRLQKACDALAPIKTGEAVMTKGFSLPAKYIIHAAGPVYRDGRHNEEMLLRSCYKNSLAIAQKHGCGSIAFPLISSGIYGYPKAEALSVATGAIGEWLMDNENEMEVSLVVFDKAAFAIAGGLLGEVRAFIDENYVDGRIRNLFEGTTAVFEEADMAAQMPPPEAKKLNKMPGAAMQQAPYPAAAAEKFAGRLGEPFSERLLRLIDAKGKSDVETYKRANLDRKLFSKIRAGKGYLPSKKTAVALAVALELSLAETRDLLERAGFALSHSVMFDVIVEYFITKKRYDIFEINNVLFEYGQPLLGG
jgi:O-acetyl-ADP-ribose deacetylase (regulator of RNase III)